MVLPPSFCQGSIGVRTGVWQAATRQACRPIGSSGCDWFFAMLGGAKDNRDKLTDLLAGELVDEHI